MNAAQKMQSAIALFDTLSDVLKDVVVECLDKTPDTIPHRAIELRRDIVSTRHEWIELMDRVRDA